MFKHALWLVGFRPFFTVAIAAGVVFPVLWGLIFSGVLPWPAGASTSPIVWHAHEMLFGFGWAVLGGFLLTASKNWVNIRGLHGGPLALAVLLWCGERGALFLPTTGAFGPLRLVLLNAFGLYVIGYLLWTLVWHRKQDSYKDNGFFVVGLPLFLVARWLMLDPATWHVGMPMALGLFRLAFAVMFERTMTQFMKGVHGVTVFRHPALDLPIKALVLAAAFEGLMPAPLAGAVLGTAALLLFVRLLLWKPLVGLRTFPIGVMYVGYFGLVLHLALSSVRYLGVYAGVGSLAAHAFTFLCMGLIIPAMFVRICQGHTGRKIVFTVSDRVALCLMGAGAVVRLVATQVWPSQYLLWIGLSATFWALCFALIGVRLVPFLFAPRIDGKEH